MNIRSSASALFAEIKKHKKIVILVAALLGILLWWFFKRKKQTSKKAALKIIDGYLFIASGLTAWIILKNTPVTGLTNLYWWAVELLQNEFISALVKTGLFALLVISIPMIWLYKSDMQEQESTIKQEVIL